MRKLLRFVPNIFLPLNSAAYFLGLNISTRRIPVPFSDGIIGMHSENQLSLSCRKIFSIRKYVLSLAIVFSFMIGSYSQAVVYNVPLADLINCSTVFGCTGTDVYNNCIGGDIGFTWLSGNPSPATSVSISFNYDIECGGGGNAYGTTLNAIGQPGTFTPPDDCGACIPNNIYTIVCNPADYNPGALNTFMINSSAIGICVGLDVDPGLAGFYAQITVCYSSPSYTTCPANQIVNADPGFCSATVPYVTAVAGCPAPTESYVFAGATVGAGAGNGSGSTFNVGVTAVTITATNGNAPDATCVFNVTVSDIEVPSITCPADVIISADAGLCSSSAVVLGAPITGDNCGVFSVTNDGVSPYPVGVTLVTWTVTDVNGNTNTCPQLVTVNDTENPTIACPANQTVNNDPGLCSSAGVVLGAPITADNCGVFSVTNDGVSPYPVGTTIVTWTVTDVNGNTNTCPQLVTVNDIDVPTITCPAALGVNTDAGICTASGVALGVPITADNCSVASVTNNAPAIYPLGLTIVTWTVTDGSGNTAICTENVTVTDIELPTIVCAPNQFQSNPNVTVIAPTTGDNCGVASTINNYNGTSDASDIYPLGTTTVTWTVTDINGNTNTCTQDITVTAGVPPSFTTCPGAIIQTTDPGVCNAVVVYVTVVAGDPVLVETYVFAGATVGAGAGNGSGSTFNVGVTNVTVTCTNGVFPDATCSFTITINDTEVPTIIPPANIIVNNDPGSCFAAGVFIGNPITGDNCAVQFIINDGLGAYPVGTTTVNWTVQDFAGNSASAIQTVQVIDNENPNSICQNISVNLDAFGNATIIPAQVDNASTDNCGIATMVLSQTNFDCTDVGPNNVILTVTDVNGNFSTCISIVTIVDNTPPSVTPPADVIVNADPGLCSASGVALGFPVVSDICGIASVTNNAPAAIPVGTNTITWTVTDINGNISTATQLVTVNDIENPTFAGTPADITINNINNACFATATWIPPTANDNCSVSSVTSNYVSGSVFPIGTTAVIYTATDASGNVGTTTFNVTVIDNQFPIFVGMPSDFSVNADPGVCNAVVSWIIPTALDNCFPVGVVATAIPGSIFPVGTTLVTYTATDPSGNITVGSFNIIVVDNQNPILTVSSPITLNADPGLCSVASASLPAPLTLSDNCGIASITNTASSPMPVGINLITWIATDVNGNVTNVLQTVNVVDNQNPTIVAPVDVVVVVNAPGCTASGVVLGVPIFADNCGVASVSNNALANYPVGVTTVIWTVTDINGNTSTDVQTVTVNPAVPIVVGVTAVPPGPVCTGDIVTLSGTGAITYAWTGGILNGVPFAAIATTTYTVTGTGAFGCTASTTYLLTVNPIPVVGYIAVPNDTVCPNTVVTLNGTGASSYLWTGGITDGVSFIIPSSTSYTVTGTSALGCTNTASVTIVAIAGALSYSAVPNDTVCEGTPITLNGTGGAGYSWTSGVVDGVPFTPAFSYTTILTGTDTLGCSGNIAVNIVVNYNPVVDLGPDIISTISFVVLDAGNIGSSYIWNNNPGLNTQTIFINNNGTYFVGVTDNKGCVGSDTINVTFSFAGMDGLSDIDLLLYPNPSNGIFTLSLSEIPKGKLELRLIDLLGHVLYANELQSQTQTFDFSYLQAATYYLQLITPDGTITKTFIITHKY